MDRKKGFMKIGRNDSCTCKSERKFKHCCEGLPIVSDTFTLNLYGRFRALAEGVEQERRNISQKAVAKATSLLDSESLKADPGQLLQVYLAWLEEEIAPDIRRHSGIFWLCLDRRFPPGLLFPKDRERNFAMSAMSNLTKTSLFHKHGKSQIESFHVGSDASFSFDISDQDLICLFGKMAWVFRELTFLPNEYRRLGKGAKLVFDDGVGLSTSLDCSTEKLTSLYDKRRSGWHGSYLSLGGLGGLGYDDATPAATWKKPNSILALLPTNGDIPYRIGRMGVVPAASFRFIDISLDGLQLLAPFEERFEKAVGLSIGKLKLSLLAVKRYLEKSWGDMGEYTLVSRGIRFADPGTFRRGVRQAYLDVAQEVEVGTADADHTLATYFNLLAGEPREYDLLAPRRMRALTRTPTMYALDLTLAQMVIVDALNDVQLDDHMKDIKGKQFEDFVVNFLQENVEEISFPMKPGLALKRVGEKDVFAEIDIYAQVEDVLFLIECKAYSVTREYLRGARKAVESRWSIVEGWLHTSDSRASKVMKSPVGANYRIPTSVRYVVPVMCSAFSEFIWSQEDKYFLTKHVPRICSVAELVDVMHSALPGIREKAFALRVAE
jgi:hypothetical protein